MRAHAFHFMIVFASLFGTQAFAGDEPSIGSRLGNRSDTAIQHDPKSSVQAGHQVSGCTFLKRPTAVRAALDSVDAAEAKRLFAKTRVEGTCINLLLANDSLRYALTRGARYEPATIAD